MTRLDQRRDEIEFEYLQYAVDNKLPVLGICRGSQIINIFFKGTLHRDITDFYTEEPMVNSISEKRDHAFKRV